MLPLVASRSLPWILRFAQDDNPGLKTFPEFSVFKIVR
jgi:hypothetical protein